VALVERTLASGLAIESLLMLLLLLFVPICRTIALGVLANDATGWTFVIH